MEPSSCHQPDWDEALVQFWKRAQQEVGPLTYGQVRDQLDPGAPSCGLQNGTWQAGQCMLKAVADTVRVQDAINDSLLNKPHGFPRLYFIDGTFPGELPEGVTCQDDLPELSSAYLLEKLLANGREAGIEAEVGEGTDPDTWVETPYALRQPCSLHEETGEPMCKLGLDGTWQRPWADTQECTEEDVAEQGDRGNKCSDVEVLLVRCLEKEIDNLDGKLKDTPWNALATTSQGLKVLQNALPVLLDLAIRAEAASSDQAGHFSKEYMHRLVYLVQKVLGTAGLDTPLHQAEAFLADLHAKKRPKGGGRSAEGRHISHMSSEVRRMVKSEQVFTVFMHLQDATELEHATLRAHWLLAMHMELQASKVVNNSLDFDRLSKARQHRCCLEELHDNHCQKLIQQYAEQWGVADYRA
ncbi:TPA: hypothetical protein ACH3X3_012852 [Trebouxia sp. C0006]